MLEGPETSVVFGSLFYFGSHVRMWEWDVCVCVCAGASPCLWVKGGCGGWGSAYAAPYIFPEPSSQFIPARTPHHALQGVVKPRNVEDVVKDEEGVQDKRPEYDGVVEEAHGYHAVRRYPLRGLGAAEEVKHDAVPFFFLCILRLFLGGTFFGLLFFFLVII